jgi:hypothetical protein
LETIVFQFDVSTFRPQADGTTKTGTIWVEIGGRPFPERGWSDFPLVIVRWWLAAVRELEAGALSRDLTFMEGDCPLMLRRLDGDRFSATGRIGRVSQFTAELSLAEIAVRLRKLAVDLEDATGEPLTG